MWQFLFLMIISFFWHTRPAAPPPPDPTPSPRSSLRREPARREARVGLSTCYMDQRLNSGIVINDLTDQTFLSKVILYTQHTAPQTYVTRCELTLKRAFSNFSFKIILLTSDFDNRHRQGPFTVYLESKFPGQQTLDSRPLTSDPWQQTFEEKHQTNEVPADL